MVIMTLTWGSIATVRLTTEQQPTCFAITTAKWLSRKRSADTASLMKFARTKGRSLRQDHRQQERLVMLKIREKLVEDERKKKLREAKQAAVKQQILRRLITHGGPCETSDDVDCLIHHLW